MSISMARLRFYLTDQNFKVPFEFDYEFDSACTFPSALFHPSSLDCSGLVFQEKAFFLFFLSNASIIHALFSSVCPDRGGGADAVSIQHRPVTSEGQTSTSSGWRSRVK